MLAKKGIRQSMSRKGNCLDNAVMENFFGGVSQILCKHRRAVKNRAKLFVGVVACPPPLEFNIGREMCACQGQRLEGRCSFNP